MIGMFTNIQRTNNEKAVKQSDVIRSQTDLDGNQDLPLTNHPSSGKLHNLSIPQFLHL